MDWLESAITHIRRRKEYEAELNVHGLTRTMEFIKLEILIAIATELRRIGNELMYGNVREDKRLKLETDMPVEVHLDT